MNAQEVYFVYTLVASLKEAQVLSHKAIVQKKAACANIGSPVTSIYEWNSQIESTSEYPILFKTSFIQRKELIKWLEVQHSYKCPCILSWGVDDGNTNYIQWVNQIQGADKA